MYYIIVDGELIITKKRSNDKRPNNEIKISEAKYNKIKNDPGKIYKWIDSDVVENDDPDYISALKGDAINIAKKECNETILNGFDFEGDVYQLDLQDQLNYNALLSKKARLPIEFEITLKNGDFKKVKSNKIDDLTSTAFDHKMIALDAYKTKVKAIKACDTIEELEAL